MEHIDALEAVRRLTLERDALLSVVVERDALAVKVKRLEGEAEYYQRIIGALQAPERRERPETDAETGEGGNGAPEAATGQQVPILCACCRKPITRWLFCDGKTEPQTCERCKHADKTDPSNEWVYCKRHAPIVYIQPGGGTTHTGWPHLYHHDTCGDWEAK